MEGWAFARSTSSEHSTGPGTDRSLCSACLKEDMISSGGELGVGKREEEGREQRERNRSA